MRVSLLLAAALALGCSSESLSEGEPTDPGPTTEPVPAEPVPSEPVTPVRAELVSLFDPPLGRSATALAFNPRVADELWVTLRRFPVEAPCTAEIDAGCAALPGEMLQISAASSAAPTAKLKRDDNAWHFMRRPSSLAFGDNGNLATCGEARTGNYDDEPVDYSGPVLWSSDPAVFGARATGEQNGTHLDMLHNTPFCMGIAHERENVYWTFNGQLGALDRYDFNSPHEIGGEDHSDGELYRYLEGSVLRVPEVPSHLALDGARAALYVADSGNARILRVDISSGRAGGDVPTLDPIPVHVRMEGVAFEVMPTPPGLLVTPSGIALRGNLVVVADNTTSQIHAFDRSGKLSWTLDTLLPTGSLGGIAFGANDSLYLSDLRTGRAYRVENTP